MKSSNKKRARTAAPRNNRKRKTFHMLEGGDVESNSQQQRDPKRGRYLRVGNISGQEELSPVEIIDSMNAAMRHAKYCRSFERPVANCVVCNDVAFVGFVSSKLAYQALTLNEFTCSGHQLQISLPRRSSQRSEALRGRSLAAQPRLLRLNDDESGHQHEEDSGDKVTESSKATERKEVPSNE